MASNPFDFLSDPSLSQDLWTGYYANNPQVAYRQGLQGAGLSGYDPLSQFAAGDYSRQYQLYQAQVPQNPYGTFTDWLSTNGLPNIRQAWGSLSPQQRGENPGMFGGRVRFI